MSNRLKLLMILLIVFLGFLLRFYNLGQVPLTLHRDEAFLGYNAYSLLKTSMDMNGNFLPLHLASFIYSPAGYSYLSIPFIAIFDLSSFSVRFASAFFGSLTVIVTFLLTMELFFKFKNKIWISFLSSFFLAISPWHINLSRTATGEYSCCIFYITGYTSLFNLDTQKLSVSFIPSIYLIWPNAFHLPSPQSISSFFHTSSNS